MANPLPHYRQSQRNFVSPYPRRGGGLPPATTPYHHPLIGRQNYPPTMGWMARIGDWLNIPEVIIVRGKVPRRDLYLLLRFRGVRVRRVGYQAATGLPWWQLWKQDTYIRVERYHGMATRDILEAEGYPLNE